PWGGESYRQANLTRRSRGRAAPLRDYAAEGKRPNPAYPRVLADRTGPAPREEKPSPGQSLLSKLRGQTPSISMRMRSPGRWPALVEAPGPLPHISAPTTGTSPD